MADKTLEALSRTHMKILMIFRKIHNFAELFPRTAKNSRTLLSEPSKWIRILENLIFGASSKFEISEFCRIICKIDKKNSRTMPLRLRTLKIA